VANGRPVAKDSRFGPTTIAVRHSTTTGSVEVQSGSLAVINSSLYIQSAGLTMLDGGNIAVNSPMQIRGGTLGGTGTIAGSVTNNGLVSPGMSPGQLIITGNYIQTANGGAQHRTGRHRAWHVFRLLDRFKYRHAAGTLNVSLTNGFIPAQQPSTLF